jgi:hypothetical protein
MRENRSQKVRGDFSIGTLFIGALIIFSLWLGVKFAQAFIDKSEIETILTTIALQSKDLDDESLSAKIAGEIERTVGIKVSQDRVVIYRTADRKRLRVDVSYDAPIRFMDKGWDLLMEASVSEYTDRRI